MAQTKNHSIAVLCDFDGTITHFEVMDKIYQEFASGDCDELAKLWRRGEISTPQEIQGCWATIHATRQEIEAALDTIPFDTGFPAVLDYCRRQGYPLAILSDGLQWYIEYILNRHSITGLTVYANQIEFKPSGFELSFPWYNLETPRRGVSKPMIIQRYQNSGSRVVFIGDGLSDVEAVQIADKVYAKGRLLDYCYQNNLPVTGFADMTDLLTKWQSDADFGIFIKKELL
jgi:2-hydroxy-3-keto-5-methylthiopentenyl-1-phosphate phosphatase